MFFGFDMKYPKEQKDYSKYWDFIMEKVHTQFYDKENITEEYVLKNFNLTNYNDYKIFIHVIGGEDNYGLKNVFCHMVDMNEDTKVILTPWDLDTTYSYNWSGEGVTYLYEDPNAVTKIDGLLTNSEMLNHSLKERYFELRESVLSIENIYKKIDSYYEQIKYAIHKENSRWMMTDLKSEVNKIKEWYKMRVEFLDNYLGDNDV